MKYLLNVIVYKYYDEPQVYLASEFRFKIQINRFSNSTELELP